MHVCHKIWQVKHANGAGGRLHCPPPLPTRLPWVCRWAGNNVTRPFRLAGAAALAPFMDKLMLRLQAKLKLPSKAAAFGLLVAAVAGTCFSILGALFFSRWVRG